MNKRNRENKGVPMLALFAFILTWAAFATLFCIYLFFIEGKGSLNENNQQKEEVYIGLDQGILEMQIKEDAKEEFLLELKEKMLTGNGAVTMLREFFPDEIIYLESGMYQFIPISDSLKKNPYMSLEIKQDEESKQIKALDENRLVSKFGIDISKHNGEIDWEKLQKTGVSFAIMRLGIRGYGTGEIVIDEQYLNNIAGANQVGVDAGVYFFTQAITEAEAIEEAEFVLENIKDYYITYPIVIDVEVIHSSGVRTEELTQEKRTDICIAFCERIKEAGYEPMIYGNMITFLKMLDLNRLEEYKKWFAYYNDSIYYPYDFDVWQYSETGRLDGISEKVDFNILFEREKITKSQP